MKRSRRKFLRELGFSAALAGGLSGGVSCSPAPSDTATTDSKGRVVVAKNDRVIVDGKPQPNVIADMLDTAIRAHTNEQDVIAGWKRLFSPSDVVGLKLNCLGGRGMSTHVELVDTIAQRLREIGIPARNIIVWDRYYYELERVGFTPSSTDSGFGYRVMETRGFYDARPTLMGSMGSCFSRILSEICTAVINVGVLKDHDLAGVSIAMKNWYGVIHNPFKYHSNNCDPYLADLYASDLIRAKHRLTIIDALWGQYKGGPAFASAYRWQNNMLIMGVDDVAIDTYGTHLIEEQRRQHGVKTLRDSGRYPPWLKTAGERGLGEHNLDNIKVVQA